MLGTLRLFLALLVVFSHLWQKPYWLGAYAVFAFYMISGYLMTLIMNRKYGFSRSGITRFAVNRILRIYPPYYLAALTTILLIALFGPDRVSDFKPPMHLPEAPGEIVTNLALIGLDPVGGSRLVPPAWALGVELVFYALIAAGLGRNRATASVWFSASLLTTCWLVASGTEFPTRYFSFAAASLPFSIGALLFHFRPQISRALGSINVVTAAALYLAAVGAPVIHRVLVGEFTPLFHPEGVYFYINLVAGFILIARLVETRSLPLIDRKLDEQLGNLSYPVYLIHWPVAVVVALLVQPGARPGLSLLLTSLPLVLLVAIAINRWIEQPIERLRAAIARDGEAPLPSVEATDRAAG